MKHNDAIEQLLLEDRELSASDFISACSDLPAQTVYSKIRALIQNGSISRVGRGKYIPVHKPSYLAAVTPKMREINNLLIDECVGIDHCLWERDNNLFVEAYRGDLPQIAESLSSHGYKVISRKVFDSFPSRLDGYIIVGPRVSEAPVITNESITQPSLVKELVDLLCQKQASQNQVRFHFQKMLEIYPVNRNRLRRYASRRGVSEELDDCLSSLDSYRIDLFSKVQQCLSSIPVTKAWVFGSFARGEETSSSDLDLLVDYDKLAHVSLLDIIRYKLDIEHTINREVDLVTNGSLKPFAVPSAERDKYLIYER